MTPEQVHCGMDKQIHQLRSQVLADAFQKNQSRFKGKMPVPKSLPVAAWINKPATDEFESNLLTRVSHFHWHIPDRMQQVGFADVELYGNLDGDEYGPNARRLIAIGHKART